MSLKTREIARFGSRTADSPPVRVLLPKSPYMVFGCIFSTLDGGTTHIPYKVILGLDSPSVYVNTFVPEHSNLLLYAVYEEYGVIRLK